jgi:hypothetical protein
MNKMLKFEKKQCKSCRGYGEKEYQKVDIDGGIIESGIRGCGVCEGEGSVFYTSVDMYYTLKQMLRYISITRMERDPFCNELRIKSLKNMGVEGGMEHVFDIVQGIEMTLKDDKITLTMELT